MARLDEVKGHAVRLFGKGEALHALRLFDSIVAAAPLEFESRIKVGDCLVALGLKEQAEAVYRGVARYALKSGHPLASLVCARVLESIGGEFEDLLAMLVVFYGNESEMIGKFAARINLPKEDTEIAAPDLHSSVVADFAGKAAERAATCTDNYEAFPETVHGIPLLSEMSEEAFRRVLSTLIIRRLPEGEFVIREGEPGQSFFFVATGEVRVFATDGLGRDKELARLHENAVFGEMALLSAQPRNASVQVVDEADLLEVTRESLAALADEVEPVATALHRFTRERLLNNMMATNPLFRPFSGAQRRDLLRRFTSHDVGSGTDIILEGDEGRGLFVVLTGEVEVVKSSGGTSTPLATLRAGDVFGEMSLVRGGPTSATVRAATATTVLFLALEYVERIVAGVPAIKEYLLALASDRELDTKLAMESEYEELDADAIILI